MNIFILIIYFSSSISNLIGITIFLSCYTCMLIPIILSNYIDMSLNVRFSQNLWHPCLLYQLNILFLLITARIYLYGSFVNIASNEGNKSHSPYDLSLHDTKQIGKCVLWYMFLETVRDIFYTTWVRNIPFDSNPFPYHQARVFQRVLYVKNGNS